MKTYLKIKRTINYKMSPLIIRKIEIKLPIPTE